MVRAGIVLYGLYPSANDSDTYKGVKPAMQLKAPISHIKDVDKGATISYGKEFIAYEKPKKLDSILVTLLSKLKIQFKTEDGNEMSREEVAKNVNTYCLMS